MVSSSVNRFDFEGSVVQRLKLNCPLAPIRAETGRMWGLHLVYDLLFVIRRSGGTRWLIDAWSLAVVSIKRFYATPSSHYTENDVSREQ